MKRDPQRKITANRTATEASPQKKLGRNLKGAGYPRGEETRLRVIESAIALFGTHGQEGTTTRAIAERAGVALPALQYYFASKEGLYLACAEHIAVRMGERISPVVTHTEARLDSGTLSRKDLTALVHQLLDSICDMVLGPDVPEGWIPFILREQAFPGPAFEVIRKRTMGRVMKLLEVALLRASAPNADQTRIRMGVLALLGHVLVFRWARNMAFHLLAWNNLDAERLSGIKADVRSHADQVLASLTGAHKR